MSTKYKIIKISIKKSSWNFKSTSKYVEISSIGHWGAWWDKTRYDCSSRIGVEWPMIGLCTSAHTHTHETIKRSCKISLVRISPIATVSEVSRVGSWASCCRRSLVHLLRARAASVHLHWAPMPNLYFHTHTVKIHLSSDRTNDQRIDSKNLIENLTKFANFRSKTLLLYEEKIYLANHNHTRKRIKHFKSYVKCNDGNACYIAQTNRHLIIRIKEH